MKFKKYFALGRITLVEKSRYLLENSIYTFFIAMILFILFNMWKAIYGDKQLIGDFTLPQMLWYLAFAETLSFSLGVSRLEKIGDEVKSGALANSLSKPYNFLGREFSIISSEFIYNFILFGIVGFTLCFIFAGAIKLTAIGLLLSILAAIGGLILNYFIISTFGMIALWTEDSTSTYWIYQKVLFIFGGMLFPLEFYPLWLQDILKYLPTTFIMYGPSKLFVHTSSSLFLSNLIGQIIWTVIFAVILILIYKKGIKEVSINGG